MDFFFKSAVFFHSFQQIMKTIFYLGCLLAALFELCMSDIYMHVPPGSNNRINGEGDNVQNANRLFDSQVRSSFHCCNNQILDCDWSSAHLFLA